MSSNRSIRMLMEMKYGKECMIEAAGIRKIPIEKRKRIKGYKKTQEQLTYHHIEEKHLGGKATEENGAIIKEYNHAWLHSLPEEEKQKVNRQLQEYKLHVAKIKPGISIEPVEIKIDMSDCIEIPLEDNTEKDKSYLKRFNRAKSKAQLRKLIKEDFEREDY